MRGFAPNFTSNAQALEVIQTAVEKAGYQLGKDIVLALIALRLNFIEKEVIFFLVKTSVLIRKVFLII